MKLKNVINRIGNSFFNGLDNIFYILAQKIGEDRTFALLKAIMLVLAAAFVICMYAIIDDYIEYRHTRKRSEAWNQYTTEKLANTYQEGKSEYMKGNYEDSVSKFDVFLDKFPSILYTARTPGSMLGVSENVNEAIIKVLLSLRKLNRYNEIPEHVKNFKEKFPDSKLVTTLDLYQNGLSALYPKRGQLGGQAFKDARDSFGKLLPKKFLDQASYSELKGESLYFIAKSYLIERDYTRAYKEFDRIATSEFNNTPGLQDNARYYAAYCLKQRGINDEAIGRYTEFMTLFPKSEYVTGAYYDLGQIYVARKQYNNARSSYGAALQRTKDQSRKIEIQLADARIAYEEGDIEKAIRMYRALSLGYLEDSFLMKAIKTLSEFPKKPDDLNEEIYAKITDFDTFVKKHGQNRQAEFQAAIGRAHYDEGNDDSELGKDEASRDAYEKAITAYKLLLDEYPQSDRGPRTKLLIANIYNNLDEDNESIKAYKRIINDYEADYGKRTIRINVTVEGVPKETDLRVFCAFEIGNAYGDMPDYEKALEWYLKITTKNGFKFDEDAEPLDFRRDPLAPNALYDAMRTLNELKRFELLENIAVTYIEDLRKDAPLLSAEAQLSFGHLKRVEFIQPYEDTQPDIESQKYKEAALEYRKLSAAYKVNENGDVSGYLPDPSLMFNLIRLYGKYYEGLCFKEYFDRSEDISDGSPMNAYRKVTTLFKTTFQPLINAPNIFVNDRDFYIPAATRLFMDLVKNHPEHEDAAYWQYLTGEYHFAKEDYEKAIDAYQKVLKNYPSNDKIKDTRDRIEEIRQKLGYNKNEIMDSSDALGNPDFLGYSETDKPLTLEEVVEIATGSTVLITTEGTLEYESGKVVDGDIGKGSGFFITPSLIATNYHVIGPKPLSHNKDDGVDDVVYIHPLRGTATLLGSAKTYAVIGYSAIDVNRDLAIIMVRAFTADPLILGDSGPNTVKQGAPVYTVGNPLGLVNVVSDGKISSIQWVESVLKLGSGTMTIVGTNYSDSTPYRLFMMTAPISPGNSGGPVLNGKGEVIGVSVLTIPGQENRGQNLNFAIPVNDLKTLSQRVGPPKPLSDLENVY